jgi:tetratricopeptide (TPR) repeat protein
LKAKLAMAIKRYDVARESLERALAADPKSAYAQFLYGFQFYEQNQMPAAIAALEKARQLNPRDARAALYLGLARESQGDTQSALALYAEPSDWSKSPGCSLDAADQLPIARCWASLTGRVADRSCLGVEPGSRDAHFQAARLRMKVGERRRR